MDTKPTKAELALTAYQKFIISLSDQKLDTASYMLGDPMLGDNDGLRTLLASGTYVYGSFNRPLWIGCESTWHREGVQKGTYAMLHTDNPSWATMVPHSYIVSRHEFPKTTLDAHELVEIKRPDAAEKVALTRDEIIERLGKHFGFENKSGTDWHILTRCKSSREVGTMTIDDFEEMEFDHLGELADLILEMMGGNDAN